MSTSPSSQTGRPHGPVTGRLVLLVGAYAPVALIIGARTFPSCVAYAAIAIGALGLLAWSGFLLWLPGRQTRTVEIAGLALVDTEVTGYLVSILLPLVAAGDPSTGDIVAYALCGALILFVAFTTDLAAVNPFIYAFGYRVARARVQGRPSVVLVKDGTVPGGSVTIVSAIGILLVVD